MNLLPQPIFLFAATWMACGSLFAASITQQPQSMTAVYPTQSATLSVTATGDASLAYQWHRDGFPLTGQTAAALTLASVTFVDVGRYHCAVSDGAGNVNSHPAWLYLKGKPMDWDVSTGTITSRETPVNAVLAGGKNIGILGQGVHLMEDGRMGPEHVFTSGLIINDPNILPSDVTQTAAGVVTFHAVNYGYTALRSNGQALRFPYVVTGGRQVFHPPTEENPFLATALTRQYRSLNVLRWDGVVEEHFLLNQTPPASAMPSGLVGVVQLVAGDHHVVALKSDGNVVSWMTFLSTDPGLIHQPPSGLTNVRRIVAGSRHTLSLKADGTVVAWGENTYQQCDVPAGLIDVVRVLAGWNYSIAIKANGSVVGWGTGFTAVTQPSSLGSFGISGLQADGNLVAGVGGWAAPSVSGLLMAKTVLTGDPVRLAPVVSGFPAPTLQWRKNGMDIPGATQAILEMNEAAVADSGTCELVATNMYGSSSAVCVLTVQPAPTITQQPQNVALPANVPASISITAAGNGVLSYQWHRNGFPAPGGAAATLSLGTLNAANTGLYHCVVTDADASRLSRVVRVDVMGEAVMWGQSDTVTASANYDPVPQSVSWSEGDAEYVLRADGTVRVPQSGSIFLVPFGGPQVPAGVEQVVQFASLNTRVLCLHADGHVSGWQSNWLWLISPSLVFPTQSIPPTLPLTIPAALLRAKAVSLGNEQALALKPDGTVLAWNASSGEVVSTPAGLVNVAAVASGDYHHLALKTDGTVVAWGSDAQGQSTVPAGLSGVKAITAGIGFSVALKSDGTVVAWGMNDIGQTSVPAGLTDVVAIRSGTIGTYATKSDGTVVKWAALAVPSAESARMAAATQGKAITDSWIGSIFSGRGIRSYISPQVVEQPLFSAPGETLSLNALGYGTLSYQWRRNGQDIAGATSSTLANASDGVYQLRITDDYGTTTSRYIRVAPRKQPIAWREGWPAKAWAAGAFNPTTGQLSAGEPRVFIGSNGNVQVIGIETPQPITLFSGGEVLAADTAGYQSWNVSNLTWLVGNTPPFHERVSAAAFRADRMVAATPGGAVLAKSGLESPGSNSFYSSAQFAVTLPTPTLTGVLNVAATETQFLALHENGSLTLWDAVSGAVQALPAGLSGVTAAAISGGVDHFLVLSDAGSVFAFGDNSAGECDVPVNLANVTAVAAGGHFSLALLANGSVVAWGTNTNGETSVPGLAAATRISATLGAAFAHHADGSTTSWGHVGGTAPVHGVTAVTNAAVYQPWVPLADRIYVGAVDYTAPSIITQPADLDVTVRDGFVLRVQAIGFPNLNYQWFKNGVALTNETALELHIPAGTAATQHAGDYHCVVTTQTFPTTISTTSDVGTVRVLDIPFITQQPTRLSVTQTGSSGSLSVTTTSEGGLPTSYQWYHDGFPISGANSATLSLSNISYTDTGLYRVVVSNTHGSRSSHVVPVGVQGTPVAWRNGEIQPVRQSDSLPLHALTKGEAWYGITNTGQLQALLPNDSEIPSPISPPVYSNAAVAAARGRSVLFVATNGALAHFAWNGYGATYRSLPEVGGIGGFPAYTSPNFAGSVVDVSISDSEGLAVLANGGLVRWTLASATQTTPPTTSYVPNFASPAAAVASGTDHHLILKTDGTVVAFGGANAHGQNNVPASLSGVVRIAAGDGFSLALKSDGSIHAWGSNATGALDVPAGLTGIIRVGAARGSAWAQHADGTLTTWGQESVSSITSPVPGTLGAVSAAGAVDGAGIALRPLTEQIVITQQPKDKLVFPGNTAPLFVVSAFSADALSYQWQKDTENISGATQNFYRVSTGVTVADAGSYRVILTNTRTGQSVTSAAATLTVAPPRLFSGWRTQHFTPGQIAGGFDAPNLDPHGTGVRNLLAHALGLDPAAPDLSRLPRLVVESDPISGEPRSGLTLEVPQDTADVGFVLESSDDLVNWSTATTRTITGPLNAGRRCLTLVDAYYGPNGTAKYYRLRVQSVTPRTSGL